MGRGNRATELRSPEGPGFVFFSFCFVVFFSVFFLFFIIIGTQLSVAPLSFGFPTWFYKPWQHVGYIGGVCPDFQHCRVGGGCAHKHPPWQSPVVGWGVGWGVGMEAHFVCRPPPPCLVVARILRFGYHPGSVSQRA